MAQLRLVVLPIAFTLSLAAPTGVVAGTAASASPSPAAPAAPAASLAEGAPAWTAVSVATLWRSPSAPRPVDEPALAAPVRVGRWLSGMTVSERRELNGRADSQALLGDRVRVLRLQPGWAKVLVPSQPTPDRAGGYPGWVPRRQLTSSRPVRADEIATVVTPTAWLRTDDRARDAVFTASFGTRLPFLGTVGRFVRVATPAGPVRLVRAGAVAVHDPGEPALPATRLGLVRTARKFEGLDYLWAGRSGFGFDCSGLTSLVHRVHGVTVPRDSGPQSRGGTAVRGELRRGDLLFYATDGVVHHVSMYVGNGRMVQAPGTGQQVEVIPTDTPAYAREYVGARRYL